MAAAHRVCITHIASSICSSRVWRRSASACSSTILPSVSGGPSMFWFSVNGTGSSAGSAAVERAASVEAEPADAPSGPVVPPIIPARDAVEAGGSITAKIGIAIEIIKAVDNGLVGCMAGGALAGGLSAGCGLKGTALAGSRAS